MNNLKHIKPVLPRIVVGNNLSISNRLKRIIITVLFLTTLQCTVSAQESFGNTLNLGVGVGYYGYAGVTLPVFHANYEIDVIKDFTLAPFVTYFALISRFKI